MGTGPTYDPKEPPVIHQQIPFLGHIIGLLQYGLRYFELLSTQHPLPAFTLQTLGTKTYVVNSPDLIQAVQKNAKTLTFHPFVSFMSPRIFGCEKKASDIISDNIDGERGNWGLLPDVTRDMQTALMPGESLNWMTRTMLTKLVEYLDALAVNEDGTEICLYKWVRTAFTVSSTEAAYGPKNPFNHQPELEAAFWEFESDVTMLLLGIAPSITARKGYQARIRFAKALDKYFDEGGPETGSDLIKVRWEGHSKYGAAKYSGVFELGNLIGLLVNATPTFFWMLVHIYSRPDVLSELRTEISRVTKEGTDVSTPTGVKSTRSVDISKLKEHCPLLLSTYQETLRLQTHNTSSRWVSKDTVIADQYLLKAGNIVQMPGYPVHTMPSIYGVDAGTFKANRFIKMETKKEKSKQHPASFRSFGGGATLCPGRHFATAELCAATAMFVMQFEMEPVQGPWKIPDWEQGKVVSAVPPPAKDIKVRVSKRKGTDKVAWKFAFEGNVSRFDV
ncbi:MAG: hypothetical protein LQ346_001710 [Caloplaca aetnensis]|nr:MAG: hypothetical protein LQ346_001710 [Caloplaca aetnensis]